MTRAIATRTGAFALSACLLVGCAASPGRPRAGEVDRLSLQAQRQPPIDLEAQARPAEEPRLLPMTYFSAGRLLETQGRYAQAIEQYARAVEGNPAFTAACNRLGLCYIRIGRPDKAADALGKAVALQPQAAYLHNNLGFAYLAARDNARARECFHKALLIQPSFARARMNLALTLVRERRDAEALSHLLSLASEQAAWYNLGTMQLGAGRPADARDSYQKALSLQADFPAARRGLEMAVTRLEKTAAPPAPVPEAVVTPAAQADAAPKLAVPARQRAEPIGAVVERWFDRSKGPMTPGLGLIRWPSGVQPPRPAMASMSPARVATPPAPAADAALWSLLADRMTIAIARRAPWRQTPVDLADVADLSTLRWASWCDAMDILQWNAAIPRSDRLTDVLAHWLSVLNELECLAVPPGPPTALAD